MNSTSWLDEDKETILLYGESKIGKTWSYCSAIEEIVKEGSSVYILNTDGGVAKTFKQYFGAKAPTLLDKVHYYFIDDITEVHKLIPKLKAQCKPNDWIIVDLMSDFWDMAQNKFIDNVSGGDISKYMIRAESDKQKFGLFSSQMWQYIKKLDNFIADNLVLRPFCNVLAVCSEKDLEIEKIKNKGHLTNPSKDFALIGIKPAGQGRLSYKFSTIVYIGKMDDRNYFRIVGDRGRTTLKEMNFYATNWWQKFKEVRK